MIKNSEINN